MFTTNPGTSCLMQHYCSTSNAEQQLLYSLDDISENVINHVDNSQHAISPEQPKHSEVRRDRKNLNNKNCTYQIDSSQAQHLKCCIKQLVMCATSLLTNPKAVPKLHLIASVDPMPHRRREYEILRAEKLTRCQDTFVGKGTQIITVRSTSQNERRSWVFPSIRVALEIWSTRCHNRGVGEVGSPHLIFIPR